MKKLVVGALVLGGCLVANATAYFAAPDGSEEADCSEPGKAGSLANAFARATNDGDEVVLLDGTYDLTAFTPGATGKDVSFFTSAKAIVIRSQSGDRAKVTLDGGRVAARAFKLTGAATVCGLTFENCGSLSGPDNGGAVYGTAAAVVSNCLFRGNYARMEGGGVYKCTVIDSVFEQNILGCNSSFGNFGTGGAAVSQSKCTACDFVDNIYTNWNSNCGGAAGYLGSYYDCVFSNNCRLAGHTRIGAACFRPSIVSNCTFFGNGGGAVSKGGAVHGNGLATLCVDCLFVSNSAAYAGATYNCVVTNSVYRGNKATNAYGGDGESCHLYDCRLYDAYSFNNSSFPMGGGSLYKGSATRCVIAGAHMDQYGSGTAVWGTALTNCLVYGCYGEAAQQASVVETAIAVNCTIVSNRVRGGSAAFVGRAENCIIAGNVPMSAGQTVYDVAKPFHSQSLSHDTAKTFGGALSHTIYGTVRNNDFDDLGGNQQVERVAAVGFVSLDPADEHFAYLRRKSIAIDAGGDSGFTADDLDLKRESRLNGEKVDDGCYEYWTDYSDDWCLIAYVPAQTWSGYGTCEPHPDVTDYRTDAPLVEGRDYVVTYDRNDRIGAATMTLTGRGAYEGKVATAGFEVVSGFGGKGIYFAAADVTAEEDLSRDCATPATAGTLTNAFARATADGDVVYLLDGTYDFAAFTPASGTYFNVPKRTLFRSHSGDPSKVVLLGSRASGARAFSFTAAGEVHGMTLRGFGDVSTSNNNGGAIYGNGSAIVSNCVVCETFTKQEGGVYNCLSYDTRYERNALGILNVIGHGGPATAFGTHVRCVFVDNVLTNHAWSHGGGATYKGTFYDCAFTNNICRGCDASGAVFTPGLVSNCTFVANRSGYYGAAGFKGGPFIDCRFERNVAGSHGGALSNTTCTNCTFIGNVSTANFGGAGYAVHAYGCTFIGNCATNNANRGSGGGVLHGGSATRCVFRDNWNTATFGGGGVAFATSLTNCLVVGNRLYKGSDTYYAGGILDNCDVVNCTVVSNIVPTAQSRVVFGRNANATGASTRPCTVINTVSLGNVASSDTVAASVSNSVLTAMGAGTVDLGGNRLMELTPRVFCSLDPDAPNAFHPKHRSGLVDVGADVGFTADDLDLAGTNRVQGAAVDIGCYEYCPKIGFLLLVR